MFYTQAPSRTLRRRRSITSQRARDLPPAAFAADPVAVVVDDDAALRDMLAVALTRCGYSVVAAADGMEALRVISLHGGNVALVLSDMSMPLVDGERLARILGVYYPHIPVALMSGAPDPTAPSRLPGVRRWLSKPFSIEALDELERSTSPARPA